MASAQVTPPDYGFNFITIGDVGNAAYQGNDPRGLTGGRGSVDYEYRMARTEVTTAQYVEFANAWASAGGNPLTIQPTFWGAVFTGFQWEIEPGKEMLPLGGVSWREAAYFVNWLHNGKPTGQMQAFLNGAYDASTFGSVPGTQVFTDQSSRSPGARYWIPSLDESMKATHYDPNRYGPGAGGWWVFNDTSDTQPVPGLPGVGETTAGMEIHISDAFDVPLESYPETRTPWGLLDASGGAGEHTEGWYREDLFGRQYRLWRGNPGGENYGIPGDIIPSVDMVWRGLDSNPDSSLPYVSLRVASVVPAPGVSLPIISCGLLASVRRRR